MTKGIFEDREHALEANYFRQQDARLIEALRQRDHLDNIAAALAEKLHLDDPALLTRARDLGITPESASALFLAPLVQVAWADHRIDKAERSTVLRLARQRGLDEASGAYAQLEAWLRNSPDQELFDTALHVLRVGFSVLPPREREERIRTLVDACREVAFASGGLPSLLGIESTVSPAETSMVDAIASELHKPVAKGSG